MHCLQRHINVILLFLKTIFWICALNPNSSFVKAALWEIHSRGDAHCILKIKLQPKTRNICYYWTG